MDNIYDFKWMVSDIDDSLFFVLLDGEEQIGSYQVVDILSNGYEKVDVKFANVNDLMKFVNYGIVRFANIRKPKDIIDIPVRRFHYLFAHSNDIGDNKSVRLKELEAFAVIDGEVINKGYAISIYKVNEPTRELMELSRIAGAFMSLNMNAKIDALEEVNLINYDREKEVKNVR